MGFQLVKFLAPPDLFVRGRILSLDCGCQYPPFAREYGLDLCASVIRNEYNKQQVRDFFILIIEKLIFI